VESVPSRTICVAMPQGTPTVRAIAECPSEAPYASRVDVIICCPQFSKRVRFVHMIAGLEKVFLIRQHAPQYHQLFRPRTCAAA
jgi:hypothetical protein